MKRKEPATADTPEQIRQRGRRQPQTSCVNCRTKKLKCDRGAPCASCLVRGISCTGQPDPKPVLPQYNGTNTGTNASVLSRLDSLERAVYGGSQHGGNAIAKGLNSGTRSQLQASPAASTQVTSINTPSPSSNQDTERQQAARFLDATYTRDDHSVRHHLYLKTI
ncbi:hypothetical protein HD806DRAFT_491164 [Xylariaceae sp. AK1471]|nr:hypothetical protein HD806DRAFT_491164 [Xylariaceae sp. AK1471]